MVFVPGFTQRAGSWSRVIERLPADVEAAALDVPDDLDFVSTAHALGEEGGRAAYVGYSMGGRLCLQLALDRPELVAALVLVSASPGIADPTERSARRSSDEQLALDIERDGVDAFLERWLAQPLFASLPSDAAGVDDRRRNTVARLAHQLRGLGQGAQPSLWPRLHELHLPAQLVVGGLDTKYTRLAAQMASEMQQARVSTVGGVGHAVHLEQPDAVAHLLTS
jgi:2-succinyl-6-hydroxy-2,4-cyclohexadiene-1-carboxylate synthase